MFEDVSYCGIRCLDCGPYKAARADDDRLREEVAACWSQALAADIRPEDVNCDGCKSGSPRLFAYCRSCQVRQCAAARGVTTCAHCEDYPCLRLETFFEIMPYTKELLERIRANVERE